MRHGPELVTFSKTELEQVDHEVDGAGCFGGSDTAESGQVYYWQVNYKSGRLKKKLCEPFLCRIC